VRRGRPRALAGLLLIAAGGWAACSRPEPLPSPAVLRARAALRRARIEAAALAPAELARAVAASASLERRLAEARADRFSPADADELDRLSAAAEAAAVEALAEARRQGERRRAELDARRGELARRLAALGGYLDRSPTDQGLLEPFGRARLEIEMAGSALAAPGGLAPAAARLAAAAADLDSLEGRLGARYARLRDPALRGRWQAWADAAVAASRAGGTSVVVDKLRGLCRLLRGGRVAADFPADLGRNGLAEKLYAGDEATPEGRYRVTAKRAGGDTQYHRALLLDYPAADDLRRYGEARRRGLVPAGRGPGSGIEIHGRGGRAVNWTNGCVALRDEDMDRLFAAVEVGTTVAIVGTALVPGPPAPPPPAEARR
jgi:L,D-transpeptidase-like protein